MSTKEVKAYFEYTALSTPRLKKGSSVWCKISWLRRKDTSDCYTLSSVTRSGWFVHPGSLAAALQMQSGMLAAAFPTCPKAGEQRPRGKQRSPCPGHQGASPVSFLGALLHPAPLCHTLRDVLPSGTYLCSKEERSHTSISGPRWLSCILGAGNGLMYATARCLRLFLST